MRSLLLYMALGFTTMLSAIQAQEPRTEIEGDLPKYTAREQKTWYLDLRENNYGIFIENVHDDMPANRAGLEAGDIIVRMNDKRLRSIKDLQRELRGQRYVQLVVINVRDGNLVGVGCKTKDGLLGIEARPVKIVVPQTVVEDSVVYKPIIPEEPKTPSKAKEKL